MVSSLLWRPYFLFLMVLNSIYILYPKIVKNPEIYLTDFAAFFEGATITSHSETHDPKTNIMYVYSIPLYYLQPNEPEILLQRPFENLTINYCWMMKGSEGYVEIQLQKAVKVDHLEYHHFHQDEIADSTPLKIDVEAITNNETLLLGTFADFNNDTQRLILTNQTIISRLRLRVVENYGNPLSTALCRFQIFGERINIG